MKTIQDTFKFNGLTYNILKRKGDICLFALYNKDKIIAYEICKLLQRREGVRRGTIIEASECLPPNSKFSANNIDKCYNNYDLAIKHFKRVTRWL